MHKFLVPCLLGLDNLGGDDTGRRGLKDVPV